MTVTSTARRTRWISLGLERLIHDLPERGPHVENSPPAPADFDVVIVGSGYGGSVAADRLAGLRNADGTPLTVCVLERGREYLPGSFPERLSDLAGHVRFNTDGHVGARGRLNGLFDMRMGKDMSVLLANGLGGGSLINAGVMAFPDANVFEGSGWPSKSHGNKPFPEHAALLRSAQAMQVELGAARWHGDKLVPNAVSDTTFDAPLSRTAVMARMGAQPVPITMALSDTHVTSAGVQLSKCVACGDCASGCNVGAKESLDTNLLVRASRKGARIVTGATVERLEQNKHTGSAWDLVLWHTDEDLRQRMDGAFRLRAKRVIVAAGTLGSTDLLMRSQTAQVRFSSCLGRGFSGNGDVLAAAFNTSTLVKGVAREDDAPGSRGVGPTIMSMVDKRSAADGNGFVLQDLGVPAPLRRLFEEATATASTLQDLEVADLGTHGPDKQVPDPCAIDRNKVDRSLAVALICRDKADGVMHRVIDTEVPPRDAGVTIAWRAARDDKRLDEACGWFRDTLKDQEVGGQCLPNPMWRMLPPQMELLLRTERGPLISVHPLGGCRMADERTRGVVNGIGQVFDGDVRHKHDTLHTGLVVLDGSIVPTSLGINPSLTIATLADFAVRELITVWGLTSAVAEDVAVAPPAARPVFRPARTTPLEPVTTEVEVVERLLGPCTLDGQKAWVELTLHYAHTPLHRYDAPSLHGHTLKVAPDPENSRVRVFSEAPDLFGPPLEDAKALFIAPLHGHLQFFQQEKSTHNERRCRGFWAWFFNRGLRDSVLEVIDRVKDFFKRLISPSSVPVDNRPRMGIVQRWRQTLYLASRAGEVRLFEYHLSTGLPTKATGRYAGFANEKDLVILGNKRLTYSRRCSPWAQIMQMRLTQFGALTLGKKDTLSVEPVYFAKRQIPLMRIVRQEDQPAALVDVAAFLLYFARIIIRMHVWSFRKPDDADDRVPQRLPLPIKGLPAPEVIELTADPEAGHRHSLKHEEVDASVFRLTRYPRAPDAPVRGPVLMIHGYSANGRSFAHETLPEGGLAGRLARRGFEPWVIDLRTSSGMPTADHPWSFEDIALHDLPVAIEYICRETGHDRIDVVSHCMGSAMLSMAMLAPDTPGRYPVEEHVRRWAMSQIGPAMHFAPGNTLRAFITRYVQHLLPELKYELQPGGEIPGVSADMFDRFVAALPYLEDERGSEFAVENPLIPWRRTPWVGTRHRLDALIGRTFDARRMSRATLNCIDDFFGPISLVTMSQPIHFARMGFVTDNSGKAFGYNELIDRLGVAHGSGGVTMLSLHAADNGLADPSTQHAMAKEAVKGLRWAPVAIADHGHQDSLIGNDTREVFDAIETFLS